MKQYTTDTYVGRDREDASQQAADLLARHLEEDLLAYPEASLIVSGGSTPKRCLQCLAARELAWHRVNICLSDERCVDLDDELRNSKMVAENLLHVHASSARLLELSDESLKTIRTPYSAVLLGMGEDGHFASIFPDLDNLDDALDLHNPKRVLAITTTASPVPRVTMPLAQLVQTNAIVLLAFGEEKRRVLDNPQGYPVAHLLRQTLTPVAVIWAP